MILTKEQNEKFLEAAKPLIKFMNDECHHPHVSVVVTINEAELFEGVARVMRSDFIKD